MREWTEQDEDRLRAEERKQKYALIDKIMQDAQKKYDQNEANYQYFGAAAAYRAMNKWGDLLTVCKLALSGLEQSCSRCKLRYDNGKSSVKQLKERKALGMDTITIDEAIELISTVSSY